MLLTPAQIEPKSFESRRNTLFFFTRGGCVSCLRAYLGAMLVPQSYQYPNLSEGADRVGGQLRGDKECPFSGVTKSGRVWRKVRKAMLGVCIGCTPLIATHRLLHKLQALVYDILLSTTAVFSYAIGSRKLSANEQFFVGAQTVVSWLQKTQIKQGVSFIAANKVYTSTNNITIS